MNRPYLAIYNLHLNMPLVGLTVGSVKAVTSYVEVETSPTSTSLLYYCTTRTIKLPLSKRVSLPPATALQ